MFSLEKFGKRKLWVLGIIALELLLILANAARFTGDRSYTFSNEELNVGVSDNEDKIPVYERGFYADHSHKEGSFIATDAMKLKKGIYSVTVNYSSNADDNWHKCYTTMYADGDESINNSAHLVDCDRVILPAQRSQVTYLSWVKLTDFYRIYMGPSLDKNGDGIFVLADSVIVVYLKKKTIIYESAKLFLAFLLIDALLVILFFRRKEMENLLKGNEILIAGLLSIVAFSSFPLFYRKIYFGDDIFYHLRRLYYLAEGLKNGAFPVKMQPGWDNGYGYAAGVCYGDMLLYPSAVMIVFGATLQAGYKFYIFLTNVLTTIISYHSFNKITGNKNVGILCGALFTLMGFRLHSVYTGATVGEFGAYTFLPMIVLGLWEIYENKDKKGCFTLAFGVTLTLGQHVLSTFILSMLIPLFCIFFIEKTFDKQIFTSLLKALGLIVLLNLYFIVPLIDYLLFQNMDGNTNYSKLWTKGYDLVKLFVNIKDPNTATAGWSGIGIYSLIILMFAAGFTISGKFGKKAFDFARVFAFTCLLLFFSSNAIFFYWLKVYAEPVYKILGNLQFMWHFLDAASVLIVLLFGIMAAELFSDREKSPESSAVGIVVASLVCALCLAQSGDLLREVIVESNPITMYGCNMFGNGSVEFAIKGSAKELTDIEQDMVFRDETAAGVAAHITDRKGTTLFVEAQNSTDSAVKTEAPLWGYRHYKAKSGSMKLATYTADTKKLGIEIPAGFSGKIKIYFSEPWFWRLSELISLATLLFSIRRKFF